MAAPDVTGFIAGAYHAQIAMRNTAGYGIGSNPTPNTVVNGTVYHAYYVKGFAGVDAPAITRETATRRAGQTVKGTKQLGVSAIAPFNLTLSDFDQTFHNLVSGVTADTTLATNMSISSLNVNKATLPQLILIINAGFQDDDGLDCFENIFYHNVTISPAVPTVTQAGGENPNPLVYTVTPTTSTRAGWGSLFSATTLALQNNSDIVSFIRSLYPLALSTYIDDGADTSIAVGYRPVSSDHAGADNIFLTNGVTSHTDVSGFSTTTGATTHTAANAGDVWSICYQTEYTPI